MTYKPQHRNKTAHELAREGIYVFPCHVPLFDEHGKVSGCSCEHWRRSDECKYYKVSRVEIARGRFNPKWLAPGQKCNNIGKHPMFGFKSISTIDSKEIGRFFGRYSYTYDVETGEQVKFIPNIGVDCEKSNKLILDADSYKDTYSGTGSALTDEDEETVIGISGSGGSHYWYDRQNKPYGNATGGLPKGIDIRGIGGYVVTTDSIHPSGNFYQWELDHSPFDIEFRPIPAGLEALLNQGKPQGTGHSSGIIVPSESKVKRSIEAVKRLIEKHKLEVTDGHPYDGIGMIWKFYTCPFNPEDSPHAEDRAAYIAIRANGAINAFCPHSRCNEVIREVSAKLDFEDGKEFKISGWKTLLHLLGEETKRVDGWGENTISPDELNAVLDGVRVRASGWSGTQNSSKPAVRVGGWT